MLTIVTSISLFTHWLLHITVMNCYILEWYIIIWSRIVRLLLHLLYINISGLLWIGLLAMCTHGVINI